MTWVMVLLALLTGLAAYGLFEMVKKCLQLWRASGSYLEELLETKPRRRCPSCQQFVTDAPGDVFGDSFGRAPATRPL